MASMAFAEPTLDVDGTVPSNTELSWLAGLASCKVYAIILGVPRQNKGARTPNYSLAQHQTYPIKSAIGVNNC